MIPKLLLDGGEPLSPIAPDSLITPKLLDGGEPLSPLAPHSPITARLLDGGELLSPIAPGSAITAITSRQSSFEPLSLVSPGPSITLRLRLQDDDEPFSLIAPSSIFSAGQQGEGEQHSPISTCNTPSLHSGGDPLFISPAIEEEEVRNCDSRSNSLARSLLLPSSSQGSHEEGGMPVHGTHLQLVGRSPNLSQAMSLPRAMPGFVYDRSAMLATNMLHLVHQNPAMLSMWASRMEEGVPRGRRDCLDIAGKLPLCLKALDIGISPTRLMIDAAQAGGVYGGGDGCIVARDGSIESIEIKGCLCRRGKKRAFSFRNIRCAGADWRHLFFVGRLKNPSNWERNADMEQLVWVGYLGRDSYEQALLASGRPMDKPMLACVSPGSQKSWLGRHVVWVKLKDLSVNWWLKHVQAPVQ